ncbi:Oidioi.mRNA.OKI2018_I69.chr1.g3426.t1.cds [Oikopleura dioica]|uniref:Oidioi.mRNA.OKI2018_I69.chr1.g3426.t1.cds n=1 Tax=Oikopleura dioica TaxID=34765 RepID=A0ABN7SVT0_OIKDI|nr:Oidioi.mRNA.OKI2018_I69.chr1.g3426.t1.cds [Oikopleura dioica]
MKSSLNEEKALSTFSEDDKNQLLAILDDSAHHKTLRSELMMNVIPTKMNANEDQIQAALVHHVMQRLSRPTLLQREGIHLLGSLKPILDRIGQVQPVLEIYSHPTEYDKYSANLRSLGIIGDFLTAIDQRKTLVCPVNTGLADMKHAMCLYGFDEEDSTFIFKNSSSENTTIKVPLSSSQPKLGYHISFVRIAN